MASGKSIVVSGDLGSGKSTVTRALSRRLRLRRVSVGDLYRQMALDRGMSALQLNLHAELDDAVDGYVDQLQQEIAKSDEQLVVDGRLAWFFFTDAFKVHLMTDPAVAATRVFSRPSDEVEAYASLAEAAERLKNRSDSERMRFLTRYGADKNRLRNYDLVCDTTSATAEEVIAAVVAAYTRDSDGQLLPGTPPLLLLDPRRVYPASEAAAADPGPADPAAPLSAGYAGSSFFVLAGQARLSAALRAGRRLIPATLAAEGDEPAAAGLAARQYFAARVTPGLLRAWEQAHQVTLPPPPRSLSPAAPPPRPLTFRSGRGRVKMYGMAPDVITLADGRRLSWHEFGDTGGSPVIYTSGTPVSGLSGASYDEPARAAGLRWISPDKPGYGGSDYHRERSLVSWADDLVALAGHLGLDRFALAGESGGGPFTLAAARQLASRVSVVALIATGGPASRAERAGQQARIRFYGWLARNAPALNAVPLTVMRWSLASPARRERALRREMAATPQASPSHLRIEIEAVADALRPGTRGAVQEVALTKRPWPFPLSEVRTPVHLWHGARDTNAPIAISGHLARELPDATLHVSDSSDHDIGHDRGDEITTVIASCMK